MTEFFNSKIIDFKGTKTIIEPFTLIFINRIYYSREFLLPTAPFVYISFAYSIIAYSSIVYVNFADK